jgi:hypothetical protein
MTTLISELSLAYLKRWIALDIVVTLPGGLEEGRTPSSVSSSSFTSKGIYACVSGNGLVYEDALYPSLLLIHTARRKSPAAAPL